MIPSEADAEFVAVLETYAKPPEHPVMDEQPPIKETRTPVPADRPRRIDYEYERAGAASIFIFCEALSAWWQATARKRRTNRAEEVAALLESRYADCEKITLVCDNLDTHTSGAFYEAARPSAGTGSANRVPPHAEARGLAEHRGPGSMTR